MTDPFARMHDRLMLRLGDRASTINGLPASRPIVMEHGVAVSGEFGEVVAYRSVAVVSIADQPKGGDSIVADGKPYILDAKLESNGHVARFFVRDGVN